MQTEEASPPGTRRSREVEWLLGELTGWLRDGLLSEDQVEAIRDRYLRPGEGPDTGRLVRIIAVLGAILVGVGLILFLAANWEGLPRPFRVVLVFAVMLATQIGGYRLRFEGTTSPRLGEALILLGAIAYGAGIWLIAQMYHLPAYYPFGALLWAAGALALAYALPLASLLILATLLLSLWMGWSTIITEKVNAWFPLLLFGLVFPRAYRLSSGSAVGVALLGLGLYAGFGFYRWSAERPELIALLYILFGAVVYTVGLLHALHEPLRRYAPTCQRLGVWIILIGAYVVSFREIWSLWHRAGEQASWVPLLVLLALLGGGIAAAHLLWHERTARTPATAPVELAGLGVVGMVVLVLFLIGTSLTGTPGDVLLRFLPVLIANLLLAAAILGTILVGYYQRQTVLVNLGLLFFCLDVVTRYFEWGWGLMDRSLFFIGAGLLLLLGGWLLERQRRRWLRAMQGDADDD